MINKLIFEKISEESPIAGVGTAGNIWMVLNALLNINENEKLFVDMETNKTINNEDEKLFDTYNAWEYYFEQIDINQRKSNKLDFYNLKRMLHYDKRYTNDDKVCARLRKLFWNNFKFKKNLKEEIDSFYYDNIKSKNTLGVQIRLTDMAHGHNVKKLEHYIIRIKQILAKNKEIKQVFLATDDQEVINVLSRELKVPIIYLEDIYRATKNKPDLLPYDRCECDRPLHKYNLGREVIIDIFLLSKCNQILKADISCVSHLAVFFSDRLEETHFLENKFHFIFNRFKAKIKYLITKLNKG
jgi:hypothetical protein